MPFSPRRGPVPEWRRLSLEFGGSEDLVTPDRGPVVHVDDPAAPAEAIREVCTNLRAFPPDGLAAAARRLEGADAVVERLTGIHNTVCHK